MVDLVAVVGSLSLPIIHTTEKLSDSEYAFELIGQSRNWNIKVTFNPDFPYSLPKSKLLNSELIGTLAHVGQGGTICLEEDDSIIIDYQQPEKIVSHYLQDILKLLERVSLGVYRDELYDEIEGYFCLVDKVKSFYQAKDKLEWIYLRIIKPQGHQKPASNVPVFLSGKDQQLPEHFSNLKSLRQLQRINVLHVPLEEPVLPPTGGAEMDGAYLSQILSMVTEEQKAKVAKKLRGLREGSTFFILLSMPRSEPERAQFLIKFSSKKYLLHPLLQQNDEWDVKAYAVARHHQNYLLERGGADDSLSAKHVAIVGCGSVGGEVAMMLAKSGIGKLTLIDDDWLDADNIYRHRLGGTGLNFAPDQKTGVVKFSRKVNCLKALIYNELPYASVTAIPKKIENIAIGDELSEVDLVVVAIGSPAVNLKVNKAFIQHGIGNVIYCWNEADSIGGHSVVLDLNNSCYECLFSNNHGISAETVLSLVKPKPGQKIAKNLTGCAGVFTPFSYLDSSRTAEMASQQAVDFLLMGKNSYALSWKSSLNNLNLETTERFNNMPLKEELPLVKNLHCGACT